MIRIAVLSDGPAIRSLYLNAFPAGESTLVGTLAIELLKEDSRPQPLSYVREEGGVIIGHICFSPVVLAGGSERAFILAPLAVENDAQKGGAGSALVRFGLDHLLGEGGDVVLVYGDPAFYGRFGFDVDIARHYRPPHAIEHEFGWQGVALGGFVPPKEARSITCVPALQKPDYW